MAGSRGEAEELWDNLKDSGLIRASDTSTPPRWLRLFTPLPPSFCPLIMFVCSIPSRTPPAAALGLSSVTRRRVQMALLTLRGIYVKQREARLKQRDQWLNRSMARRTILRANGYARLRKRLPVQLWAEDAGKKKEGFSPELDLCALVCPCSKKQKKHSSAHLRIQGYRAQQTPPSDAFSLSLSFRPCCHWGIKATPTPVCPFQRRGGGAGRGQQL